MKIVFMGTPQAAAKSLERLVIDGHEVVAAYTQPDRPAGRGKRIAFSPVKELGLSHGIRVLQPSKIRTTEALDEFRALNADVAVVVAYGRILPASFLCSFPKGAINVHFSLLPKYRGAAPVNWAIVNGETRTGVTTMKMDSGLDTGDILIQQSAAIDPEESAIELMDRLAEIGAEALSETLKTLDSLVPRQQDHREASYAPILKKEDGLIDWSLSANEIERRIRGFQPFPTSFSFNAGSRLTVWRASIHEIFATLKPGSIVEANGENLVVACGEDTALAITEIQPEGKRRMPTRDFLNGAKLKVGDMLTSG